MYARIFVFIGAIISTVALAACSNTGGDVDMVAEHAVSHVVN